MPPEIEKIIENSLRKDKHERYQTIKDLLVDLQNAKLESTVRHQPERTISPDIEEPQTRILQAATTDEEASQTITAKNRNDSFTIKNRVSINSPSARWQL